MGRSLEFWYKVSSKCNRMTKEYEKWRSWWEPLMLEIVRRENRKNVKTEDNES